MKFTFILWIMSQVIILIGSIELLDLKWYWIISPTVIYILHFPLILLYDFIVLWITTRDWYIDVEFKDDEKLY